MLLNMVRRDEALARRMPTRLMELVQQYPYGKVMPLDEFLPRPKFSTRQYDALFVRIETEVSNPSTDRAKLHPIRLVVEALKAQHAINGPDDATWSKIRTAAITETEEEPIPLDGRTTPSCVFAEETVRFLTLLPAETPPKEVTTPKFTLLPTTSQPHHSDKHVNGIAVSSTATSSDKPAKSTVATTAVTTTTTTATASSPPQVDVIVTDWSQFATAGFHDTTPIPQILAGTFLDKDVEKTVSAVPRKPSKKRKAVSPARSKRSLEADKVAPVEPAPAPAAVEVKPVSRSTTMVAVVELDEAFVDFWSDALLDPVASAWPNFVICKLKNPVSSASEKSVGWLVIEHVYKTVAPPPPVEHVESAAAAPQTSKRARPSSPKPSFRSDLSASRVSSTIAATKRRFSFFTNTRTSISNDGERSTQGRKKAGRAPKVGEMGEILSEEEENRAAPSELAPSLVVAPAEPPPQPEVVKPVVAAALAAAAVTATVETSAHEPEVKASPTPPAIAEVKQEPAKEQVAAVAAASSATEEPATEPEPKNSEVVKPEAPAEHADEPTRVSAEPQSAAEPASTTIEDVVPAPAVPEKEIQVFASAEPSGATAVSQIVAATLVAGTPPASVSTPAEKVQDPEPVEPVVPAPAPVEVPIDVPEADETDVTPAAVIHAEDVEVPKQVAVEVPASPSPEVAQVDAAPPPATPPPIVEEETVVTEVPAEPAPETVQHEIPMEPVLAEEAPATSESTAAAAPPVAVDDAASIEELSQPNEAGLPADDDQAASSPAAPVAEDDASPVGQPSTPKEARLTADERQADISTAVAQDVQPDETPEPEADVDVAVAEETPVAQEVAVADIPIEEHVVSESTSGAASALS